MRQLEKEREEARADRDRLSQASAVLLRLLCVGLASVPVASPSRDGRRLRGGRVKERGRKGLLRGGWGAAGAGAGGRGGDWARSAALVVCPLTPSVHSYLARPPPTPRPCGAEQALQDLEQTQARRAREQEELDALKRKRFLCLDDDMSQKMRESALLQASPGAHMQGWEGVGGGGRGRGGVHVVVQGGVEGPAGAWLRICG